MAGTKVEALGGEEAGGMEAKSFKFNQYATKKTFAQGLLDIGLLMANASQLNTLIAHRSANELYYWPNLVLISLSILIQVVVGIILLVLGGMEAKTIEEKRHVHKLNDSVVGMIFAVTVINVFIAAFGIKSSEK